MSGLSPGGKVVRAAIPTKPDPKPTPVTLDAETLEKERAKRMQRLRAAGRGGTILTEGLGGEGTLLGGAA